MVQVTPLETCVVVAAHPDKVALTRQNIPEHAEAVQLAAMFRLFGDPRRVRILYALCEAGELCVCDLSAAVEVPESSVSQALRLFRAAGVVENRRDGRMVYYRLSDAHVRMLLDLSREHTRHGRSS